MATDTVNSKIQKIKTIEALIFKKIELAVIINNVACLYIHKLSRMRATRKFPNQLRQPPHYLLIMRKQLSRMSLSLRDIDSILAEHNHLLEESPPFQGISLDFDKTNV